MKSSLFLVATSAMLAVAGPIDMRKRAMATEWDIEVVTVTVTAGSEPSAAVFIQNEAAAPAPAPETTVAPEPVPETTAAPAPAPEPKTSSQPAPAPKPAPVVVEAPQKKAKPTTTAVQAPAPSAPSSDDSGASGDYQSTCLKQHNIHRMNHSAPALQWDDQLAGWAQQLADTCVFAHDTSMGTMGQNLASWGSSGDIDDEEIKSAAGGITNQWYNSEMVNWNSYGSDNPPPAQPLDEFGHFTQLVWKGTQKVGCATVKCDAGTVLGVQSWYTVCNYSPPGNYGGEYGTNVLKPLGEATVRI